MRRRIPNILLLLVLTVVVNGGCQAKKPGKYIPGSVKKKEKLATPEPGTYLKPAAYTILRKFNDYMEEPESIKEPGDWMRNLVTRHQKKVVDTLLRFQDLEVPVRIYYPNRESLGGNHPVTLFFHGGGFIIGSVEEYNIMVSKLAKVTGNIFISVEYRLAPEYPYPAAVNDCLAALQWLQKNGSSIGADTARISLMGDSAGGNLATVMTLICRDREMKQPARQVLIYPGVTFTDTLFPSRVYFTQDTAMQYLLSEAFLRRVKSSYLPPGTSDRDPYVSPLEAELTPDLPPALVITAEVDPVRDGGRLYARRLEEAGVAVEHIEYSGMFHGFMSLHMILKDGVDAMQRIENYLGDI